MSQVTVLIVEDDQQFHGYVKELLEVEGYKTLSAYNGLEAIDIFNENTPQIVVLDLLLPLKDGIRVMTDLRATHLNLPIIAMSGGQSNYSASFLTAASTLGAAFTLNKPFKAEQLLKLVKNCSH